MSEQTESSEVYPVESIIAARRTQDSFHNESNDPTSSWFGHGWDYCLKWEGYVEPSWEPFKNVRDCKELLQNFWEEAGAEAMVTNIPEFEVYPHPIPKQLRVHGSPSGPIGSPTKKKKESYRSGAGNSKGTPPRKQPPAARKLSLKVRISAASTSGTQPPTNPETPPKPTEVSTTVVTPLSPPLTPEPEPEFQPGIQAQDGYEFSDSFDTPHSSSPFFEPDPDATPTLVPDDNYASPPTMSDINLNSWGLVGLDGVERSRSVAPADSGSANPLFDPKVDFAELLLGMSPNEILSWPL